MKRFLVVLLVGAVIACFYLVVTFSLLMWLTFLPATLLEFLGSMGLPGLGMGYLDAWEGWVGVVSGWLFEWRVFSVVGLVGGSLISLSDWRHSIYAWTRRARGPGGA